MNQKAPKKTPFTEDPTQKELTSYATFLSSPYTSKFCDHYREDNLVYVVEDESSEDKAVRKINHVHVVPEDLEEGEGSIERKDLYAFCQNVLGKDKQNLRGYWEIEVTDAPRGTTPPLPVFQFGTLGLEIHPAAKGIIRLGTWDVELILKTCIKYQAGKNTMRKVSGSGISDDKIRFRWCLRGPMVERDSDADSDGRLFGKNKLKSLVRKVALKIGS